MASAAHAEDWLAGEYEVTVPDHSSETRYVLLVSKDDEGRYRHEVFEEVFDALTGPVELRALQEPSTRSGVQVMRADEMAQSPELAAANVRCAIVGGMGLCQIPDGASITFDGRTLHAGYFGFAMHVGLMEVRKRVPGIGVWPVPPGSPASR